jgi:NADPH:quinone reductase-like Zn-dependent oxidoreductase
MSTYEYVGLTSPGQLGIAKATIPEPSEGEVLIKVEYSVLGPFDINNLDRQFHVPQYPYVLGIAAAGTVAKVGAGIMDLGVGDRVRHPTSSNIFLA